MATTKTFDYWVVDLAAAYLESINTAATRLLVNLYETDLLLVEAINESDRLLKSVEEVTLFRR